HHCVLLLSCYVVHFPHPTTSFSFSLHGPLPDSPPFPTRRSSDLVAVFVGQRGGQHARQALGGQHLRHQVAVLGVLDGHHQLRVGDRKSTRLNSSHVKISYAVFCVKKKKIVLVQNTQKNRPKKTKD